MTAQYSPNYYTAHNYMGSPTQQTTSGSMYCYSKPTVDLRDYDIVLGWISPWIRRRFGGGRGSSSLLPMIMMSLDAVSHL